MVVSIHLERYCCYDLICRVANCSLFHVTPNFLLRSFCLTFKKVIIVIIRPQWSACCETQNVLDSPGYTGQPSPKFEELRWSFKTRNLRPSLLHHVQTKFGYRTCRYYLSGSSDAESVFNMFQNIQEMVWEHVNADRPIVQKIHYTLDAHTPAGGPICSVGRSIVMSISL